MKETYHEELANAYQYAEINVKDFLKDYTVKETEEVLRKNLLDDFVIKESEAENIIKEVLYTPEIEAYIDSISIKN